MLNLRPYQEDIVKKTLEALQTNQRVCIGLPTAGGKTVIARFLIDDLLKTGKTIIFIVNRMELVKQTIKTFKGDKVSVLKAGMEKHFNPNKPIQIVMIQTWYARREKIQIPNVGFIIWDEFHEGTEQGLRHEEFLKQYAGAKIIGMTATPITAEGFMLGNYDVLIDPYRTRDLQDLGFLVKDRWYSNPKDLKLESIGIQNGDYIANELNRVVNDRPTIRNVLDNFKKFASTKKTIVFAVSIEHAEHLLGEFQAEKFRVELLHSELPNLDIVRHEILERFKKGETQIIINVGILTTGFDETSVECILLARPTKSLRLYIQMVGRGLRLHEGKKECLVLDCANNVWEHGLATDSFDFTIPKGTKLKQKKKYVRMCPQCECANPYKRETCISCGFNFEINKREFNYKILNEDIVEIDIQGVTIQERGIPDLRHIVDLFTIAKNLNEKTIDKSMKSIQWFITEMHKSYGHKFETDDAFFKFLQEKIIICIRRKHSFYKIKYDFMNHFNEENSGLIDQLKSLRGFYSKPCPQCGQDKLKRTDSLLKSVGEVVYHCQNCGMGFTLALLESGRYVPYASKNLESIYKPMR